MIHYEDLRLIYDEKYVKASRGKLHPDRYILRECVDCNGHFWICMAVFARSNSFAERYAVCTADTFDEVAVWCDLHSIKLHHVEHLRL